MNRIYEQHREVVNRIADAFSRRFGWEKDEARAEANLAFVMAASSSDDRGNVSARIGFMTKRLLLNRQRDLSRKRIESAQLQEPVQEPEKKFDLDDFLSDLSPDGRRLVKLVLDPPYELLTLLSGDRNRDGAMRAATKRYLRKNGWTRGRIQRVWNEVKGALP